MFICTMRCAALLMLLRGSPAVAEGLTEREVLRQFLEQSPQARELRARTAALKAELQTRSLFPNPSVSYSRESAGFTEFFEAQQALPINGRLGYLKKATVAAASASEADARFTLWGLRCDVRAAFHALVRAQVRGSALQQAIDEIGKVIRILAEREKEGEGSKYDRLRAEREAVELRAELAVAETLTIQARSNLLAYLPGGLPGNNDAKEASGSLAVPPPVPADQLLALALRARGDYRVEEDQIRRYQLEQSAASRLRFPDPVFSAGLKRADSGRGDVVNGPVVTLSVPLPIFNRGAAEVQRFQAEELRARARRDGLLQQITAQVEGAYQTLAVRRRAADAYAAAITSGGTELTRIAQVAYQEGELGILELLDALRVNRQSQLRLLDLQASAREAQIELERVVGEEIEK